MTNNSNKFANVVTTVNNNMMFYKREHSVDGYAIELYDYMFASYKHFVEHDAFEMRGYTVVKNSDGSVYKEFYGLHKFFNVNQYPEISFDALKEKKIRNISSKEDGSLITFIELPNGNIVAKTKMGFDNDQTDMVNKFVSENPIYMQFVRNCMDMGVQLFFELVSPFNRIVLEYKHTNLVLIKARRLEDGQYVSLDSLNIPNGISVVDNSAKYTLSELLEMAKTAIGIEGWIVEFDDFTMAKVKTSWYFEMHHLCTEKLDDRYIVKYTIENTIDDVLSKVGDADKAHIDSVMNAYFDYVSQIEDACKVFQAEYDRLGIAQFGKTYEKAKFFGIFMSYIRHKKSLMVCINEYILKYLSLEWVKKNITFNI